MTQGFSVQGFGNSGFEGSGFMGLGLALCHRLRSTVHELWVLGLRGFRVSDLQFMGSQSWAPESRHTGSSCSMQWLLLVPGRAYFPTTSPMPHLLNKVHHHSWQNLPAFHQQTLSRNHALDTVGSNSVQIQVLVPSI